MNQTVIHQESNRTNIVVNLSVSPSVIVLHYTPHLTSLPLECRAAAEARGALWHTTVQFQFSPLLHSIPQGAMILGRGPGYAEIGWRNRRPEKPPCHVKDWSVSFPGHRPNCMDDGCTYPWAPRSWGEPSCRKEKRWILLPMGPCLSCAQWMQSPRMCSCCFFGTSTCQNSIDIESFSFFFAERQSNVLNGFLGEIYEPKVSVT